MFFDKKLQTILCAHIFMSIYFSRCFPMDVETMMNQEKADFAVSFSIWPTIILSFFT